MRRHDGRAHTLRQQSHIFCSSIAGSRSHSSRRPQPPPGVTQMTVSIDSLRSISSPDQIESRIGTLDFIDGVPTGETAELVYDQLDFVHGVNVYLDGFAGSVDLRDPEGLPRGGRRGQLDHHLLGADGVGVRVPDRERRHGLFPRRRRSDVGTDGRRDASAGARGVRRHVVGVDHRLRPARPGPRRRRPFPARPTRLRRPAAGQRLPRRTLAHVEGAPARTVVPDGRRPGADG